MNLNKGISTPIAILLIIAVSAVVGVLVWQFTKPAEQPSKQAGDYSTQSACEEAGYYWYDDACHEKKLIQQKTTKWNEYSNSYHPDYVISYPDYMKVSEVGQNNRRAIISTQDYKIDMTNGKITSGFKVDIFVSHFDSLDDLFYCNKEKLRIEKNCLLALENTQLVDYQKGEVETESITIDGYPGIKYEFISSVGKNNNIGLVVKKDDKYYVVLVAYRTHKDMDLFNQILDSFKFKR